MYTFQALQILIFLIPGFVSSRILNMLVVRNGKKELEKFIEALIFSMLIYMVFSFVSGIAPIEINQENSAILYNGKSFLLLIILSVFFPIPFGFLTQTDWHMGLARKLRLSKSTSRDSVWYDVFCDSDNYITIEFENGRRICGWPLHWASNPEKPYIYLTKPAWVVQDEKTGKPKYVDLDVKGILITPEQKIETIVFMKNEKE